MAIKIGHASADENLRASGGKAGDQTNKEVCTRSWYSSPWDLVLRCKDSTKAEKMAKACEAACANSKIGYDQYQRNTLSTQAKAANWDLSKVTVACECDCSSLMTVCAQCAGIDVPYVYGNSPYTGNMKTQFLKTGEFEALTDSKYMTSDKYLKRGDILVRTSGHTAMALENGSNAGGTTTTTTTITAKPTTSTTTNKVSNVKIEGARSFSKIYAKTYRVTASALNMRAGAGTSKTIIKVLPNGAKFTCYGYYTNLNGKIWLYGIDSNGALGYCSMSYLA